MSHCRLSQFGASLHAIALESPQAKARLRASTERAVSLGLFGAPSFVVGSELFWGNDRLDSAMAWADSR